MRCRSDSDSDIDIDELRERLAKKVWERRAQEHLHVEPNVSSVAAIKNENEGGPEATLTCSQDDGVMSVRRRLLSAP